MSDELSAQQGRSDFIADLLLIPNLISVGRVLGVLIASGCFFLGSNALALFFGIATGLTDYLDGYLARKLNQTSQLGALLDILADLLLALVAITVGVYTKLWPAYLIIVWGIRDMTVMAMRMSAAQQGFSIPASVLGKVATNVAGFAYILLAFDMTRPFSGSAMVTERIHQVGLILIHLGIAIQWAAGIVYLRSYARRYRRNPERRAVS
ncbi:MAG TPA: CDP-alcohol phosphatidyltransferase family protein [Kofleriaceae bacterium]|nr:CDP-alcohol phosphatidyltransferase family protein [Kofleriaceae bacterium]